MEVKQQLRAQEERSQSSRLPPSVYTLCATVSGSVSYNTLANRGGVVQKLSFCRVGQ